MKFLAREPSRKLSAGRKRTVTGRREEAANDDAGARLVFAPKRRKLWRFAPDAIGMMKGPRNLSEREGLSA